ncbi:Transcriptional regulator ATRX [Anthophora retusa]
MDISSMLEVQVNEVKEMDVKENVTPRELVPIMTNVPVAISQEERNFYKLMFGEDISAVRFHRLHCTACDVHIGSAPANSHNMFEHPILHTLLCAKCRDFYGDGTFEQGDDATDMFCRWCANGGNLYCCSFCSNTFCCKCIKRNFDPILRKKIEADERWKCFVCDPTDLYAARGTCWALLQYIQAMRVLQNNCNWSQEEIDAKMNTDETNCCPRRRKRMRRRQGSNSEEDDKTYIPKLVESNSVTKRRKRGRGKGKVPNGNNMLMSDRSFSGMSEDNSMDRSEILPSLFSCEQTLVECENVTVNEDGTIISQHQASSVLHRVNPVIAQPSTMYNTSIMNVNTSVSPTISIRNLPNILCKMNQMNQVNAQMNQQINMYQAMHSAPVPMVAIPNQNVNILNQSHFSLPESQVQTATASTNVIEIESDPEDVVVALPRSSKEYANNKRAVPVALVSSKNNYHHARRQEMEEKRNAKTLNQRLIPHGQEVNNILVKLKNRFQGLFDVSKREELTKYDLNDARLLVIEFHREIRNTITELACINDRIVREYNKWKRYQMTAGNVPSSKSSNRKKIERFEEIPLDMTCTNDSDSDTCASTDMEYGITSSDLIGSTNAIDGIMTLGKRSTVERGVGNNSTVLVNKSVQIYDTELEDYDKCIKQSALKTQQTEKKDSTSALSLTHANKHSSNYEAHYIRFLQNQNMEVQRMQTGDIKELPDRNETTLKDLIGCLISDMIETMDKSATPGSSNPSICVRKESDLKPPAGQQQTNAITYKSVDDLVKMISNINNDLDVKKPSTNESMNIDESQNEADTHDKQFSTSDDVCVVNVLKNENHDSSRTNVNFESGNEDDCTIIDD